MTFVKKSQIQNALMVATWINEDDPYWLKLQKRAIREYHDRLIEDCETGRLSEASSYIYRSILVKIAKWICQGDGQDFRYLGETELEDFLFKHNEAQISLFYTVLMKFFKFFIRSFIRKEKRLSREYRSEVENNINYFIINYKPQVGVRAREFWLEPRDLLFSIIYANKIQRAIIVVLSYTGARRQEIQKAKILEESEDYFLLGVPEGKRRATLPKEMRIIPVDSFYRPYFDTFLNEFGDAHKDLINTHLYKFSQEHPDKFQIRHDLTYQGQKKVSLYPHLFRHTFVTLQTRALKEAKALEQEHIMRKILGHRGDSITTSIYQHISTDELVDFMMNLHYFKVLKIGNGLDLSLHETLRALQES